ncbi:Sensor protein ZraS [Enhygromyxa salina]|uniref:histidine kinase n=2 Tax=Enhygromyxa salina TaxID=215803 RepID=A0A2S9YRC8_9BACT|nr:Sensor protein ZraS [Enhygromyxa salina]
MWGGGGGEVSDQVVAVAKQLASLGQLAAEVGHEISRPLQVIAFAVDDLRDALFNEDREVAERCIEGIEVQIQRTAGIVGRMLAFDRAADRTLQRADLNDVVEQALAGLHDSLAAHGIQLQVALGEGLPPITCCRPELVQAVINLVLNAREAVLEREGAEITVRTVAQQGQVWVDIADNGRGIAPEHLARIFDPFFTTKPDRHATGLGLSITRGITRRHGGNLEVSSTIGKGARLRLGLPSTSGTEAVDLDDSNASSALTH